jgi:hypothetical protein
MLLKRNRYLPLFLQRTGLSLLLVLVFSLAAFSQNGFLKKDNSRLRLSPILYSAFKHPVKPSWSHGELPKRPILELMSWPNYPLTAAQIAARDAKYDRPVVAQIAEEALGSYLNGIINGKSKKPAVKPPKF